MICVGLTCSGCAGLRMVGLRFWSCTVVDLLTSGLPGTLTVGMKSATCCPYAMQCLGDHADW